MARGATAEPLHDDHERYLWAGYRKGAFAVLGLPDDLSPPDFGEALDTLLSMYGGLVVASAPTRLGMVPVLMVGLVNMGAFVWGGDAVRMPWASPRNVLEGQVAVVDFVRQTHRMLFTSALVDKPFWTQVARYGVISRVGTLVDGPEPLSMWETRSRKQ